MSSEWSRQIAREIAKAVERRRLETLEDDAGPEAKVAEPARVEPVETAVEQAPEEVPAQDGSQEVMAKEAFEAELKAQGIELTHLPEPQPVVAEASPAVDPEDRPVLMEMRNITLRFGGVTAIRDISFDIREGEIRAIIGPNGAGKSSMLNVINGFYHPQEGEIWYRGKKRGPMRPHQIARQGIARTFQNIALFKGMSTLDNIMTGRFTHMNQGLLSQAVWRGAAEREENANREVVEKIIDFLEIQHIRRKPVGSLPYGLQKRVELGRALAAEPGLLLLDEPMAGMNIEEKEDMSRFILDVNDEFGTTIALIEHDMGVVMDISDRVVVLDYGRKIGDGTPDEVRRNEDVIDAYLGVSHD